MGLGLIKGWESWVNTALSAQQGPGIVLSMTYRRSVQKVPSHEI